MLLQRPATEADPDPFPDVPEGRSADTIALVAGIVVAFALLAGIATYLLF